MQNKMNIVWLVQDHVTWKHYKDTAGPKPTLVTYDKIAAEGTVFNRAYTVTPLCSPARASMATGVYAHKHGITRNDEKSLSKQFLPGIKPFNQYLQQHGYRTGYFGKWHAGMPGPMKLGFEGFSLPGYGNPYGSPEYADYLKRFNLPDPVVDVEWTLGEKLENFNLTRLTRFAGGDPSGFKGASTAVVKSPKETMEAYFISQLACDWLEQRAQDGEPFVMRVDVWGPHQPYIVAEPFKDTIDPKQIPEYPNFRNTFEDRPRYHQKDRNKWRTTTGYTDWEQWQPIVARAYETFAQTDAALGKVLDALERTGLLENTIVIYTADHGDILGSNGGLFDKDSMLTEETMCIPLAVRMPGASEKGVKLDALVSNMDIVPTVLEMADVPVPSHMDGKSIVPLLNNPASPWREDLMAMHFGHINHDDIQRVLYHGSYKYAAHLDDSDELYDLSADPFELKNLIHEPDMRDVLQDMRARLHKNMVACADLAEDSARLIEQKTMLP
ncbi:sulfatase-like hydrolase/transferase [Paenibacillus allorhizosphaerae]|uniref:Ulvan-active sulfatase n=1 Tax=Paenibacillus allorhizosphaerae TaxID=2849866 RepID=A0ABM8V9W4_9BACL|nr:sulfatase-like hydrolase/transferase [Paenibacillus allorhizosphaerae]CAG7614624.1 Ulvan-active sulfatase [Paenibacillus allorhizosphaerae]